MHLPLPTHSLTFSKIKLIASAPNFYHLTPLIRFFFHLPRPQRWSILFQPLSLKFTNSFLLLKIKNVPSIPSQLSFWNSASMNSVQSSQILSISLFLKEFFHRHSNKHLSSLFSKKTSLSTDDLNNFRPISNLIFISKILEKVVASRIQSHLSSNSLSSSFQFAYRIFHSTETTLLKIHNDLILAMNRGEVTSLILLDLYAAFDTVDSFHPSYSSSKLVRSWWSVSWLVLILSLTSLSGSLNQWFHLCILYSFLWCTPRLRSLLGPLLFTLYTTPLYYYRFCSQIEVPEHSNCRLVPYWREFLGVSGSRTWSDTPFANT